MKGTPLMVCIQGTWPNYDSCRLITLSTHAGVRNFIYKILVLGHQKAQAEPIHVWNIDKDFMVHELTPVLHRRSIGWELQIGCACWFRGARPLLKLSLMPWTLVVAVVDLIKPPRPIPGLCEDVSTLLCGCRCVCEATRGLLSPGFQCDKVSLLLLPLSSGFLFVVPNYGYIYSLLSMFVGIFLSRGFSTSCSSCWYLLWLKGFDCYSLLQFSFRQPLSVYIFLYL